MIGNPLVPLGFEGLCAVIGPILFLNSDDVVPVGIVEVDLLLVGKMPNLFIDWVVPNILSFLWNPCYHVVYNDQRGW